jgi:hypothetical protein
MRTNLSQPKLNPQSGMSVVELMIAAVVLVVGMLAVMALLALATGNNGRSKIDSTATMLTQSVVEQISAVLKGGGPGSIYDSQLSGGTCVTGTKWIIDSAGGPAPSGNGAALAGSKIDFTQTSPPTGYQMNYSECNVQPNGQANLTTYDVRWNVQTIDARGTFLVTVGARPVRGTAARFNFALPVNMRVYVGAY